MVGEAAQRRLSNDPSRVAREFKRRIGDPTPLLVGGSPVAAEALTARLAKAVVATVAEREGSMPERITVTHPAAWGPFKLDLLQHAMRMADLRDVTFVSEPEAAAWEYAATRPLADGATIAVYDLGGGTFDATLLSVGEDGFAVLGEPEGIDRFGGIDIDQAVFAFVVEALDGAVEALDPDDPVALSGLMRLRADCVEAKEALSSDHEAAVPVVLPNVQTEVRITRPELEAMIRPVMGDTVSAMRRALQSAGTSASELSAVLLVGGSSRIPLVGEVVSELLGRPVAVDAHPKHLVAMGAARHAAAGGHLGALVRRQTAAPSLIEPAPVEPAPVEPAPVEPVRVEPIPVARVEPVPVEPVPIEPVAAVPVAAVPVAPAPLPRTEPVAEQPAENAPPSSYSAPPARPAGGGGAKRLGLIGGAVVAVVAAIVAAVVLLGGSGGDGDAGTGGGDAADACPSSGPFVCITEVSAASGGGLEAAFRPIEVTPGSGGTQLVFFLADVISTNHGASVVTSGAPLPWNSTDPFQGWTDSELATRSVVCAGVVSNGNFIQGSGNCANLP
jgi:actin-like ATPase involved in cell morphogenesis